MFKRLPEPAIPKLFAFVIVKVPPVEFNEIAPPPEMPGSKSPFKLAVTSPLL
ncbi:hypothetical protein A1I_07170 [Rickettsia bellii OSU 85-389]|nr:hypothetical protein A1I_07170 [Rickettsia bellii OSU 85-389]